jgi:hypothetical protein
MHGEANGLCRLPKGRAGASAAVTSYANIAHKGLAVYTRMVYCFIR